jgi:enoyl-CoA hydratase/carnithine racemase
MVQRDAGLVLADREDGITTVRLNRPDKLNAANDALLAEFVETLSALHEDPGEGLVITGAGRATCAGRDLDVVSDPDHETSALVPRQEELLETYPRPSAVAAKGATVGLGFHLALDADFVVLGEETHFSYPEISHGIVRSVVIDKLEPYVGPGVAKEIVMGGEPIDPRRAYDLGLVNDLVPEDEVESRTDDLLRTVLEHDHEDVSALVAESRLADR